MKKLWLRWRRELPKQVSICGKNGRLPFNIPSPSHTWQKTTFPDSIAGKCGHVIESWPMRYERT